MFRSGALPAAPAPLAAGLLAAGLLAAGLLAGCGAGEPAAVPIAGRVVDGGTPVGGAQLSFWSPAKRGGASATVTSGPDGTFALSGAEAGLAPGEYVVTVERPSAKAGDPNVKIEGDAARDLAPRKFRSSATSPLSVSVPPAGADGIVLDLSV